MQQADGATITQTAPAEFIRPDSRPPLTYIRQLTEKEGEGYAVCSDDGKVLARFPTYDSAFFTARQFRLEPLPIH